MELEIERKFLISEIPGEANIIKRTTISQGYLSIDKNGTEVRIREIDGKHFLTVKTDTNNKRERNEYEMEINKEEFIALWSLTKERIIKKTRYLLIEQNHYVEIDEFHGRHKGLLLAEVEFSSKEDAESFTPPVWFKKEVTEESSYRNKHLANVNE